MKATMEIVKFNVNDVVTTSGAPAKCAIPGVPVEE